MTARQFAAYAAVGSVGTLAHYTLLIALVESRASGPVAASAFGFVLGAVVNYALNRRYTFRSRDAHRRAFPRFMSAALLGLGLNSALMGAATAIAGFDYRIAQLISTGAVLATTFAINRAWTFREGSRAPG